ncbi:MAG: helix-turn-helix domain-containing protein [Candidatus Poseidoniaceae archaeon]
MIGGEHAMNVPLRHISVDVDAAQGAGLPGLHMMDVAEHIEVLSGLGTYESGMDLVVEITFREGKDVADIPPESSLHVHTVHARNGKNVVATVHTTGPIMRLFTTTEGCWLSRPTWLNRTTGLRITISGTANGVRAYRKGLDSLVPGDLRIRISRSQPGVAGVGPTLSPRRREVLETAQLMGYYDTPRRSSQRELAERLGIRQATVAEHLQRAERDLIAYWIEQNID